MGERNGREPAKHLGATTGEDGSDTGGSDTRIHLEPVDAGLDIEVAGLVALSDDESTTISGEEEDPEDIGRLKTKTLSVYIRGSR